MTDAERAAYNEWLTIWSRMSELKKFHTPDHVPLALWVPLETQLNAALHQYRYVRRTARAA